MTRKKTTAETPDEIDSAPESTTAPEATAVPVEPPPEVTSVTEDDQPAAASPETSPAPGEGTSPPVYAADPHPKITVSLGDYAGGPRAHLLRSHRFHQMQIRFEGEQPPEEALARLKDAGWVDRTETEGIWTKQIDRDARWQSVQMMEQEFKAATDAIRQAKGLGPALEAMTPA